MKLSSKEKAQVLQVYNSYWEGYLSGDVAGMSNLLDNNYTQVGSAETEVFSNKKDAVKFLHETIDQVAGKAEIRNQSIKLEYLDDYILVNDLFDIYVLTDGEWVYYANLRASTLMSEANGKWKFIHQHSSVPDIRTEEGENIATDKIAKENLQLRDAIKRRTVELEQKNCELEIEAALERVRARAMAMNKSEELGEAAALLYKELRNLGVNQLINCGYVLVDEKNKKQHGWLTDGEGNFLDKLTLPLKGDSVLDPRYKSWKRKDPIFSQTVGGEEFKKHQAFVAAGMDSEEMEKVTFQLPDPTIFYCANFSHGYLHILSTNTLSKEEESLLIRFTSVFQMTYRRFLDLQKAEEQAREAMIEVALERVRGSSMAMHHSRELPDMALTVLNQLDFLGIQDMLCNINIVNPDTKNFVSYSAVGIEASNKKVRDQLPEMSLNDVGFLKTVADRLEKGQSFFTLELKNADLKEMLELWKASNFSGLKNKNIAKKPEVIYLDCFQINELSTISVSSTQRLTEEQVAILQRMTSTFSLSYTRFLDLQKAEEQAREAQIEAALERVRSKTMAMHNSHDVGVTVVTLFDEVLKLGLDKSIRCGIGILEGNEGMETWSATSRANGEVDLKTGMLDMSIHPMLIGLKKAWKKGEKGYSYDYIGKDVTRYYNALNNEPEYPFFVELESLPQKEFHNSFFFSEGILFAFTAIPITEEIAKVLNRFASVFGQTYRRYLDLQKAETQAREAQIEAALERIRARALAMHSSKELMEVAHVLREQMGALGQSELIGSVVHLYPDNSEFFHSSYSFSPEQKRRKVVTGTARFQKNATSLTRKWLKMHYSDDNEYTIKTSGAELKDWIKVRNKEVPFFAKNKTSKQPSTAFYHGSDFSGGALIMSSHEEPSHEAKDLQRRAASVFDLAYRRFLDLQKAEVREKEAIKQSSLDRVRAEIASMRTANDLNRITPLVWQELTNLGVPFFRCGVFIMDVKAELAHAYLSTPSGSSLTALELKFDSMPLVEGAFKYWQQQKVYIEEWDKKQFIKWTKPLVEQGQIANPKKYQGGEEPPERLVLQMVPFKQGMLYVGSAEKLTNEQIELVKSLADSFSVAYARYEDFKQLEDAKGRIENTLSELKSTQTQLIQSEKMASLGELTAGIAHEIQNPLNFVNNFSEVSGELVDEINEEIKAGNLEEVEYITTDLKQNLEKINHHGKRASGIVKGMLEHSRTGSGEKELTDINKLADEYLRLSYHGLRAKDKSFNADFKTEFDESLSKVKVITQDLGRVILNLINNAFYAVYEKARAAEDGNYKPTVKVSTKKLQGNVELIVQDNGQGIPKEIVGKIFQPFFTTKPSGSGTGLGLSMSYDIITKGHGGELKVVAEEGEGTEFIITLPL